MIMDPDSRLDYAVDWTDWLQPGEQLDAATWTIPSGPGSISALPGSQQVVDGRAIIWLTGGTPGQTYDIVCHIRTSAGLEDDRTMRIACRPR